MLSCPLNRDLLEDNVLTFFPPNPEIHTEVRNGVYRKMDISITCVPGQCPCCRDNNKPIHKVISFCSTKGNIWEINSCITV